MPAKKYKTFAEALGVTVDEETGEKMLTLNTRATATCACGLPPRLKTINANGLTVKYWLPAHEGVCQKKVGAA